MKTNNSAVMTVNQVLCAVLLQLFFTNASNADALDTGDKSDIFARPDHKYSFELDEKKRLLHKKIDDKDSLDDASKIDLNSPDSNKVQTPNQYDGSEYNASTFIDTDFSKHSFQDLFAPDDHKQDEMDSPFKKAELDDKNKDDDPLSEIDRLRKKNRIWDKDNYLRLVKPVYYQPGDWVPSGLDSTWNGGFTTPPDNGSPVPYRLNGHVNEQRKLPWQD